MTDDDGAFNYFSLVGAAVVGALMGGGLAYLIEAVFG